MNINDRPVSPISFRNRQWKNGNSNYKSLEIEPTYPKSRHPIPSPLNPSSSSSRYGGSATRPALNSNGSQTGFSSPDSVARSSFGAGSYPPDDNYGSRSEDQYERTLFDHYDALKRYLSASLKDEKGNPRPNRARDKLLRLSSVQFEELSTDVFDELMRRMQSARRNGPNGRPAPFLLPRNTFHPKRNQARQKLSTLPPLRFRDLATDVFYELERRFPRFMNDEAFLTDSPETSMLEPPSSLGSPIKGVRIRRPSEASSVSYSMRSGSQNSPITSMSDLPPSPSLALSEMTRPKPKTFQSHTIVPNKGTIIEDDETGGEEGEEEEEGDRDVFSLEEVARTNSSNTERNQNMPETSVAKEPNRATPTYENKLTQDETPIRTSGPTDEGANQAEIARDRFEDLKKNLEHKLADAQSLNKSLQTELERVKAAQANTEKELRNQIQELQNSLTESQKSNRLSEIEAKDQPQDTETNQQLIAEEIRLQAQGFLKEMRMLSELSGSSYEREQQLLSTIKKLEDEVKQWKNRYAKAKTQFRSSRASAIDVPIIHEVTKRADKSKFTDINGAISSYNVTKFQISIDELLCHARTEEPDKIIESMKTVIFNVRDIIHDTDEAITSKEDITLQQKKMKSHVSITAKNLITATKNYTAAKGLSPVSLLDAAASHLTAAIINLIQTFKIQPIANNELEDNENDSSVLVEKNTSPVAQSLKSESVASPVHFQGLFSSRLSSNSSSKYSPVNSPRDSNPPLSSDKDSWKNRNPLISPINASNFGSLSSSQPTSLSFSFKSQESDIEELKIQLEDHTALLVQNIQSLVTAIRSESGMTATGNVLNAISEVVQKVITSTEKTLAVTGDTKLRTQVDPIIRNLSENMQRLSDAGITGRQIAEEAREDDEGERAWRNWNQSLPPIAFQIAREMKELVLWVDRIQSEQNDARGE
ncbi:hypothetical protein K3495_g12347 [Podosphaera aphanis]|nr:hypothetical protein K3495_g12347 [Podosphaera aphanis]